MSESQKHIELLKECLHVITELVSDDEKMLIEYDSSETKRPPRVIGGFIPDVFYCYKGVLIIGEAKTYDDFGRDHSKQQYAAYLKEFADYFGETIFVIAVPWQIVTTAKNYFKKLRTEMNLSTKIIIVNELGKVVTV